MHKEQIVGIAVRLFAVFLVFYTLRHAVGMWPLVTMPPPDGVSAPLIVVVAALPILAAVLLWLFPLSVARRIIPRVDSTASSPEPHAAEIELVAFSVMGLWVLTFALSDAVYWITYTLQLKRAELHYLDVAPDQLANMVATVAELAVGLWLLFGSRGIVEVVRHLRRAGRK